MLKAIEKLIRVGKSPNPTISVGQPTFKRSFLAGQFGRLQDLSETVSITADIQGGMVRIRNRARALTRNDGYAANIISSLKTNIVGDRGISFSCQAKDSEGALDTRSNIIINQAFGRWCKYGNCTVEGNADFVKVQELVLETVAIDGECLVMIRRGAEFGVDKIQLEVIQVDQLDENYYDTLQNGNTVFQGVELNRYFKPQAYWIWKYNLNDPSQQRISGNQRIRVDAKDIIHIYDVTHPKQIRGISWLISSILPIHHLNKLSQAEVEMARLATIKQFVYKAQAGVDGVTDVELEVGADFINRTAESGVVEICPPGYEPQALEWSQSQNNNNDQLAKRLLRNAAAGVNVSYNTIAKDLESVNYSSARFGQLEDRAFYSAKQRWLINVFNQRVYQEWLSWTMLNGLLTIDYKEYSRFSDSVKWQPRGFSSVDPAKDVKANTENLKWGLTTRSEILAKEGRDFTEVLHELIQEELAISQAYVAAGLEPPKRDPSQKDLPEANEEDLGEPNQLKPKSVSND